MNVIVQVLYEISSIPSRTFSGCTGTRLRYCYRRASLRKKALSLDMVCVPQLKGLGRSATSQTYGLGGLAEARAYLAHPILGQRLREATSAMLAHRSRKAEYILGELDALKFRSCLTLFSLADPAEKMFINALERFFDGEPDSRTNKLLDDNEELK